MNILITGGSGFIGSHLIENLLKTGHSVINVDNFDSFYDHRIKMRNTLDSLKIESDLPITENKSADISLLQKKVNSLKNYKLYNKDFTDFESIQEVFKTHSIDLVIHLAALAGVRPSIERPLDYAKVNILGSMHLWELCKEFNVKKFICASSSSVYGNNEKVPFGEKDVVDFAISPYAATKKSGEVLGHVYHKLYEIDMIQLRFFTVYGPRQRPDLAIHKFTRLISNEEPLPFYGDGTTARDYTFIDDIIEGILKSMDYIINNDNTYEILNLGESEVITLKQMVQTLEQTIGKKAQLNKLPMQPGDVNRTNADISKAKQLIGYAPKTSFKEGIKKFVEWYNKVNA